jgi:hypothetical protein
LDPGVHHFQRDEGITDAIPILEMEKGAGGGLPPTGSHGYILASRLILVGLAVGFILLVRAAWKHNGYDDRRGFDAPAPDAGPDSPISQEA